MNACASSGEDALRRKTEAKKCVGDSVLYVQGILAEDPDAVLLLEQRVEMPSAYAPGDVWGTADVLIYLPHRQKLHVIDYKHGAGVPVDVWQNRQLAQYGTSAIFGLDLGTVVDADFTIIQPRAKHADGPIRTWTVDFDEALHWLCQLDEEIRLAQAPDAPLIPGEKQCRFCAAAATCPARDALALQVTQQQFVGVKGLASARLPSPNEMDVERVEFILEAKAAMLSWLKDVEEYAVDQAKSGVKFRNRKLVEAIGRRTYFGDHADVAARLCDLTGLGLDDVMPRELIGVVDAEKKVIDAFKADKAVDAKKASELARIEMAKLTLKTSSSNLTLVPLTDKRPEVSTAQHFFPAVALPPSPLLR